MKKGFTLVELVVVVVIISVIAAVAIPLIKNGVSHNTKSGAVHVQPDRR
jgi:prepilin-type N-terminal cleavage/methylation domain-containing protein